MFGGRIGFSELLLILVIVVLVFGTKKLRNMGGDLGSALKNFRTAMREGEEEAGHDKDKASLPGQTPPTDKKPDGQ